MQILLWLVVNAVALWAADLLVPGIRVGGEGGDLALNLVVGGAVLGAVNAVVRPVVRVLSIPFIVLTLGLFWIVINALMLMLGGVIADALGFAFEVTGFWPAVWGSIVISLALMVLTAVLPGAKR